MPLHAEAECAPTSTAFVTLRQLSVTWRGSRVSQVSHGHGLVESGCEMRSSTMYVIYGVNYGYIIRITNVIYDIWYIIYMVIWINTYFSTIFNGMNIHLPAILMWTTGVQGFDTLSYYITNVIYYIWYIYIYICISNIWLGVESGWLVVKWVLGCTWWLGGHELTHTESYQPTSTMGFDIIQLAKYGQTTRIYIYIYYIIIYYIILLYIILLFYILYNISMYNIIILYYIF